MFQKSPSKGECALEIQNNQSVVSEIHPPLSGLEACELLNALFRETNPKTRTDKRP